MSSSRYNWTHKKWCRPSDPVNVVFEGIRLDEVEEFLLKEGWESANPIFAWSQVIPFPSPLEKSDQNLQMIKPVDGFTGKFRILKRIHIRLWDMNSKVIAGVHIDSLRVFRHLPADFESVEKLFADICKRNPDWEVIEDSLDLDNRFAGHDQPFNNGKATVVRRKSR